MSERLAVHELHDHESAAAFVAEVVDGADVGMVQGRGSLRLALEAGQGVRVPRDIIGQELQSNISMQPGIFGLIHHAYSTATQLGDDAVMRNGLANQGVGGKRNTYGIGQRGNN